MSGSERLSAALLCAALLAVGGLAWWLQLRPPLRADPSALASLPRQIEGWRGADIPLREAVENVLQAEFNLQRVYRHATGDVIWLYVGYYGTGRGGRPEHTPRGCYTGAGWHIAATRRLDVDPRAGLRVNEFLVEREGERRLVHFWYRSHRRTGILGGLDQNLDRLVGRLRHGRADGALIRLSTPARDGSGVSARSRLLGFASRVDELVGERWPAEHRAHAARLARRG